MNCVSRILPQLRDRPGQLALWTNSDGFLSFQGYGDLCARAQALATAEGLQPGDPVLLLAQPGQLLYAAISGFLALGIPVVFVEPWMPISMIEHFVNTTRPKVFVGSRLAQVWGLRVAAIRKIPRWISLGKIKTQAKRGTFHVVPLDGSAPAIITFTSGTGGQPKGIVRTHQYMWDLHEILSGNGTRDLFPGPDLCIFPNYALFHIGTGRGAILVPSNWRDHGVRVLAKINQLARAQQPQTLTCGPAFLQHLLTQPGFTGLKSVYVGGALTDRWIFESAFARWGETAFTHVYGGTEVEPVALCDARIAVKKSAEKGHFQTLFLGRAIPQLRTRFTPQGLWVSGPNVAAFYLGQGQGERDNLTYKHMDESGTLWHCMGDRILPDENQDLWFGGRTTQAPADFILEQKIYSFLASSQCMLHRRTTGKRAGDVILCGQGLKHKGAAIRREFPEISAVHEVKIYRDHRHRARIDRGQTLSKAKLS